MIVSANFQLKTKSATTNERNKLFGTTSKRVKSQPTKLYLQTKISKSYAGLYSQNLQKSLQLHTKLTWMANGKMLKANWSNVCR